MSICTTEETVSCLTVNTERILHDADTTNLFLIELIIVTDRWEMCVPTPHGHIPLERVKEGKMTTVYILGDKLKCLPKGELEPVLQTSCVLQAIRKNPQIGRTWIVQFTLHSAVSTGTKKIETCLPCWDEALAAARRELEPQQEEPGTNSSDHACHILDDYHNQLRSLEITGWRRLKEAKRRDQLPGRAGVI
ncbi:hypothetical protein ASPFODRAFT_65867 [Aspergillus luchuensis CBS 106.47]|uniref:Uncharacterized protein n=1 Tax=Aspergillus luchuensis (strain CBS 106.47) TaxID=1137211 RepID=A0A1M3T128_ASPLC|nr:hypothetical protein ASPFODRAFT_65867 [Aspergillus luchuensis CBS 106.47]